MLTDMEFNGLFEFMEARTEQVPASVAIRDAAKAFAEVVRANTPDGIAQMRIFWAIRNLCLRGYSLALPERYEQSKHVTIRDAAKVFRDVVEDNTPTGADQTAAVQKIRGAEMAANAAISCDSTTS